MKKIFLPMLLFCTFQLTAQLTPGFKYSLYKSKDSVYTKTITFNDKRNIYKDTLRFNRKYRYVLTGINRFVFKEATAEETGENFNTQRHGVLTAMTLPSFLTTGRRTPDDNASTIAPVGDSMTKSGKKKPRKPECLCKDLESIAGFKAEYNSLKTADASFQDTLKLFATYAGVNKRLMRMKSDVTSDWQQIKSLKMQLIRDSLGLTTDAIDRSESITSHYILLRDRAIWKIRNQIFPSIESLIRVLDSINETNRQCLFEIKRIIRCLDTCKSPDFIFYEALFLEQKRCVEAFDTFQSDLTNYAKQAKISIEAVNAVIVEGKIDELQKNYHLLTKENYELELDAFVADNDSHEITFATATTEGPLPFGIPSKRVIKVRAMTAGGLKVDFSTGAFFNWGDNNFLGPSYYYEKRSDTTKVILETERSKRNMLSVGALMHISTRMNTYIRPAASFGVSTTLSFETLNFHGGVSGIIGKPGKPDRIILTVGITLKESELLNNRYRLNEVRDDYPDTVPTSKNFPLRGGFFSLTYNLTGINR